ncbi:MAG: hypothetical protein ACFFDF_23370 [Candidatus Odinarchaeota archaeon]
MESVKNKGKQRILGTLIKSYELQEEKLRQINEKIDLKLNKRGKNKEEGKKIGRIFDPGQID